MSYRPFALAFASLGSLAFAAATEEPTKEQTEFFEGKIRPILAENCYKCHSVEKGKAKGDLTIKAMKITLQANTSIDIKASATATIQAGLVRIN